MPRLDKKQTPVDPAVQAVAVFERLKVNRTECALPVLIRTPKISDYADKYFAGIKICEGTKKAGTIEKGESHLPFGRITGAGASEQNKKSMSSTFGEVGVSARTVNLDVIALRNVLKRAMDDGWMPTHGLRPLNGVTKRKLYLPSLNWMHCAKLRLKSARTKRRTGAVEQVSGRLCELSQAHGLQEKLNSSSQSSQQPKQAV